MNRKPTTLTTITVVLVLAGSYMVGKSLTQARRHLADSAERWHSTTVSHAIEEVSLDHDAFAPLNALGDSIELRLSPAPARQGTEIAARLNLQNLTNPKVKALGKLKAALRDTQSLIETGEVLHPDVARSTRPTLTGLPLDIATHFAKKGGRI